MRAPSTRSTAPAPLRLSASRATHPPLLTHAPCCPADTIGEVAETAVMEPVWCELGALLPYVGGPRSGGGEALQGVCVLGRGVHVG